MNVGQLKKLLATVPDEALIVIPGSDHSYRSPSVDETTAALYGRHICEDHGEHNNEPGGKVVPVLLLS